MKWLTCLRLSSLSSLLAVAAGATHQLRASASLLGVSRHGGDKGQAWDYNDQGQSWLTGNCPNGATDFSQSPVNISTTVAATAPDHDKFFFRYPVYEAPVKMINDGRFLYTRFPTDDDKIGGFSFGSSYPHHLRDEYLIYKIVFHSPSEHTFNGQRVPLEAQLFHRRKDAELMDGEPWAKDTAILAVGFHETNAEKSPFLRALINGELPDQRGETKLGNRKSTGLDFSEVLKPVFGAQGEKAGFWDYTGSLTQPPCTGGVRWLIRQETLNARRDTLRYFKESVRKASGGVPDNARALQIIGTRPVFPRYAQNAVHLQVFSPEEPAAFREASARVKEHQTVMKKALNGGGSKNVIKKGGTVDEAVAASREYKRCMAEVGRVMESMNVAKVKKTSECNMAEGSLTTLKGISGGPARLEAAAKHAAFKKSCQDQTRVASALEAQSGTQQKQCGNIKQGVVKKWEKEKKADEARAAKAAKEAEAAEAAANEVRA